MSDIPLVNAVPGPAATSLPLNTAATSSATTKDTPALATTKRKFHRLLENITGNTSRSKSSSDPTISAAKRIRLEARGRLEARSAGQVLQTSQHSPFVETQLLAARLAAASVKQRRSADSVNGAVEKEEKEPNYVPWSHDRFLRRLRTFADVLQWTPKPERIGEVQWAKRGWVCVGWNTVACKGGCEQRVVVGLRPARKDEEGANIEGTEDYAAEINDDLVSRYVEIIRTGHEEGCLWRDAGCKDDIYRLPIAKQAVWHSQLYERYSSLNALATQLPPLSNVSFSFNVEEIASQLPPLMKSSFAHASHTDDISAASQETPHPMEAISSPPLNHTALAFALLGWSGSPDPALATCSACFRRIGLWLYATPQIDVILQDTTLQLDLLANHRDYCPWVNATSQAMPGSFSSLSAGQILQRLIANNAVRPATSTESLHSRAAVNHTASSRPSTSGAVGGAGADGAREQTDSADQEAGTSASSPPKRDAKQVEKEDKARFARLKELTKLIGLKRSKTKKT